MNPWDGIIPQSEQEATAKAASRSASMPDLAIVDLDREYVCRREDVRSSAGYSIYEGRRFTGKVEYTLVRGRFVLRDGALIGGAIGTGRYISRAL
jgi:dihydropyrimidinase